MQPPDLTRLRSLAARLGGVRSEMQDLAPRFEALRDHKTNGSLPRVVVAHQLFQTPKPIAERVADLLGDITGLSVLEPSAGLGRLADALRDRGAGEIQAVDSSPRCCEVLKSRPWLKVTHADFLECQPEQLGLFDVVAMNPPFTMRSDIKHILHATRFLIPGGRIAGICMSGCHREEQLRPLCDSWEILPAGTFRESGTDVETVLFSLRK